MKKQLSTKEPEVIAIGSSALSTKPPQTKEVEDGASEIKVVELPENKGN